MKSGFRVGFQPVGALRALARNDEGATAIEYALIAGGIALAIAATVPTVGTALSDGFTAIAGSF